MGEYRRWYVPGGTVFFTAARYARRPILTTREGRLFLRKAIERIRENRPFSLLATVLLPDHWHLVMQLPPGDRNYSVRVKRIKSVSHNPFCSTAALGRVGNSAQPRAAVPRFGTGFKEEFTTRWLGAGLSEAAIAEAKAADGERGIWQPRFWEHAVRDEDDLEHCIDYIHWNPCRHGLATRVRDWRWSSFQRFVTAGHYPIDWGGTMPPEIPNPDDWGEP